MTTLRKAIGTFFQQRSIQSEVINVFILYTIYIYEYFVFLHCM